MGQTSILLVEPEKELRLIVSAFLEGEGYPVEAMSSLEAGLKTLKTLPAKFNLVIVEPFVPERKTLPEQFVRQAVSVGARVIVVTSKGDAQHALDCQNMGVAEFETKPFDLEDLLTKIEKVMARP